MSEIRDAIYNAACKGNGRIDGRGKGFDRATTPAPDRMDRIKQTLKDVLVELPEGTTAGEILEEIGS